MYAFFFQAEDGIRDYKVTGVQTCALPICPAHRPAHGARRDPPDREPAAPVGECRYGCHGADRRRRPDPIEGPRSSVWRIRDQGGRVLGVLRAANEGRRDRGLRQTAVPGGRGGHRRGGGGREGAPPAVLRRPRRNRRESPEEPSTGRGRDRGADLRASGPSGGGPVGDGGPAVAERLPQANRAGLRTAAESEKRTADLHTRSGDSRSPGPRARFRGET